MTSTCEHLQEEPLTLQDLCLLLPWLSIIAPGDALLIFFYVNPKHLAELTPQKPRRIQKKHTSLTFQDNNNNDNDEVQVINTSSAASKGKKKVELLKEVKSSIIFKPPKPAILPFIHIMLLHEKVKWAMDSSKETLKMLGKLEKLTLVTSAKLRHAQAKTKKVEGMLDMVLSEISIFHIKYNCSPCI